MILSLTILLMFQLAGEVISRAAGLPVPGPVLGMAMIVTAFLAVPRLADLVRPAAQGILANLSLLFVPAGVGVVGHLGTIGQSGLPILAALVVSTILAIGVGAVVFAWVSRLTGGGDA